MGALRGQRVEHQLHLPKKPLGGGKELSQMSLSIIKCLGPPGLRSSSPSSSIEVSKGERGRRNSRNSLKKGNLTRCDRRQTEILYQ